MLTLIENTVRVTIRNSDSEPTPARSRRHRISRETRATGAEGIKAPERDDRIMAELLRVRERITATPVTRRNRRPNIAAKHSKKWKKNGQGGGDYSRYPVLLKIFSLFKPSRDERPVSRPLQSAGQYMATENEGLLDPPQTRRGSAGNAAVIIAAVGDMAVAVERDISDVSRPGDEYYGVWVISITCHRGVVTRLSSPPGREVCRVVRGHP